MKKHLIDFELFKVLFPSLIKLEIKRFQTAIDQAEDVYFIEAEKERKITTKIELKRIFLKKLPFEIYLKCFPPS
ncbi:hypothetical protein DN752_23250 [Echinicola strongylocentroti]|uniref:Uncharacterized protein n=1 Tax=Echinicola strongylocentroti TaxID=1795355 RepID=A0A2Z4IP04_9BACT|nr:hypothetical protein [Echinicola strongylocentroti]AWW32822.1 hypothetical protein DN752_23250 [Echinicola strongylocentroti]